MTFNFTTPHESDFQCLVHRQDHIDLENQINAASSAPATVEAATVLLNTQGGIVSPFLATGPNRRDQTANGATTVCITTPPMALTAGQYGASVQILNTGSQTISLFRIWVTLINTAATEGLSYGSSGLITVASGVTKTFDQTVLTVNLNSVGTDVTRDSGSGVLKTTAGGIFVANAVVSWYVS